MAADVLISLNLRCACDPPPGGEGMSGFSSLPATAMGSALNLAPSPGLGFASPNFPSCCNEQSLMPGSDSGSGSMWTQENGPGVFLALPHCCSSSPPRPCGHSRQVFGLHLDFPLNAWWGLKEGACRE